MVVYKYQIYTGEQTVYLPAGAQVLHVAEQHGSLQLWAAVDPNREKIPFDIRVIPTGFAAVPEGFPHLGTIVSYHEHLVWHVFGRPQ